MLVSRSMREAFGVVGSSRQILRRQAFLLLPPVVSRFRPGLQRHLAMGQQVHFLGMTTRRWPISTVCRYIWFLTESLDTEVTVPEGFGALEDYRSGYPPSMQTMPIEYQGAFGKVWSVQHKSNVVNAQKEGC